MTEELVFEKICDRELKQLDQLSLGQRLLAQQMLMFVKNGHTHKFVYKISFGKFWEMKKKFAKQGVKDCELRYFIRTLRQLADKKVSFIDESGQQREFTWLTNLEVDYDKRICKYNFCKPLSKICLTYDGRRFVLQLLDFVALESKTAKRLFRFLGGCRNRNVTIHKVSALLKYFFVFEPMNSENFFQTVIEPAVKELNQKVLFTFNDIASRIITKDGEDFIEIVFCRVIDKHLPIADCKMNTAAQRSPKYL